MSETIEAGSIFDIRHSRKGDLTVRFLEGFQPGADAFVNAEILEGTARFMSDAYRDAQADHGLGTQGDTMPMRASLLTLKRRRVDLEARFPRDDGPPHPADTKATEQP